MKLFCFPYAGGSATAYRKWNKYLSDNIVLYPVELAGRGTMARFPLYNDFGAMVDEVFGRIKQKLTDEPYGFFGHSMGAQLSFELAHRIRDAGVVGPKSLFISGCSAPNFKHNRVPYHLLSEDNFKSEVTKLGGVPPEILDNQDIFNYYAPILRSDFRNLETFKPRIEYVSLDCDFIILHGESDKIPLQAVEEWRNYSSQYYQIIVFSGGHFFINDHIAQIADVIKKALLTSR